MAAERSRRAAPARRAFDLVRRALFAFGPRQAAASAAGKLSRLLHTAPPARGHTPQPPHPFDINEGIDAGGHIPWSGLRSGEWSDPYITAYLASAPSGMRSILDRLGEKEQCTFVDIGCGKGRVLAVASEYPFKKVVGVEISPDLFRAASTNAGILNARHPDRPRIEVVRADALQFPLPAGNLMVCLFNPFYGKVLKRFVSRLEAALTDPHRFIWIIYVHPRFRKIISRSPKFDLAMEGVWRLDDYDTAHGDLEPFCVWRSRQANMSDDGAPGGSAIRDGGAAGSAAHV